MADFRTVGRELSNWGRWGEDDEIGTVNLITPDRIAAAATLARTGRVFDLGYTLGANGPQVGLGGRINPVHLMSVTGEPRLPDGGGFTDDFIFMPLQCATQWDGLAHVFYDDRCYNDVPASTITARGAARLSIDQFAAASSAAGCCSTSPRSMASTICPPSRASVPTIWMPRSSARAWRSGRAISCSCAPDGGRCSPRIRPRRSWPTNRV